MIPGIALPGRRLFVHMEEIIEFQKYGDTPAEMQRMVDTVVRGLRSQGFQQSMSASLDTCRVRGTEGRKCAAGWLLPDDLYTGERMETIHSVFEAVLDNTEYVGDDPPEDMLTAGVLIRRLQHAHDGGTWGGQQQAPEKMEASLREVVADAGLIWPEGV